MRLLLFCIGAMVGAIVVHFLQVPLWLAGPVIGLYIWWFIADDAERLGW